MSLVTEEQLKVATGYERRGDLERALISQRVRFFYGKAGTIWTTESALDAALNINDSNETRATNAREQILF